MTELRASHMKVIALPPSKIPNSIIILFLIATFMGHTAVFWHTHTMCDDQIWVNWHI